MKAPLTPPDPAKLFKKLQENPERFAKVLDASFGAAPLSRYEHWDKMRHLEPPDGLTPEEWWLGLKFARKSRYRFLPLHNKRGAPFVVCDPDCVQRELHWIDKNAAGSVFGDDLALNREYKETFLIKSLINEAITSSQLEGAATTRKAAKEMIHRSREPSDKSERMIMNNYLAMEHIKSRRDEKLTPRFVFELHRILTEGTLDDPKNAGVFRKSADNVVVSDMRDGEIAHVPPPAGQLPERMEKLCSFANDDDEKIFLHPVVKAILLHFMIGYDHPFVDGNGRLARALFYWYIINHGYWLLEYISISQIIKMAPAKYMRAYLYTETDDSDTTYFIIHQLEVIRKALRLFQANLEKQQREIAEAETLLNRNVALRGRLNARQVYLIRHALKNPGQVYDIKEHQNYHGVSYNSARTDLHALADDFGLLEKYKSGKTYLFRAPADLRERLTGFRD